MKLKGVNSSQLARAIGVSHVAIGNYLKKGRQPRTEEASKIAEFFGVTIDHLLNQDRVLDPITYAARVADAHPGDQAAKQIAFEENLENIQYWQRRALEAEKELKALKRKIGNLTKDAKV